MHLLYYTIPYYTVDYKPLKIVNPKIFFQLLRRLCCIFIVSILGLIIVIICKFETIDSIDWRNGFVVRRAIDPARLTHVE